MRAQTDWECSQCRHSAKYETYMKRASCKLVVVRKECTHWMVVQGLVLWVGIFVALNRVDGWVIIWRFLLRFLVSFWCLVYYIVKIIHIHA
jgi:hypothetical protein